MGLHRRAPFAPALLFASATAAFSLAGLALGTRRRGWLWLPAVVQSFMLQHALQGWCPPLPVLRRLGFRTQQEIERERYTLRALLRDAVGTAENERPAELPARDEPREASPRGDRDRGQ